MFVIFEDRYEIAGDDKLIGISHLIKMAYKSNADVKITFAESNMGVEAIA